MEKRIDLDTLTQTITVEIINALGVSKLTWARGLFNRLFHLPAWQFSQVAARFDSYVAEFGFREAAERILPIFANRYEARGVENIPTQGPLLIVSNHPGTCDSLVIAASVPRPDLKIIATGVNFLRGLPAAAQHLIYCTLDPYERMSVIRASIRHLKDGGALLIFPTGQIDPDPALQQDAPQALDKWSASLDVMLRCVPQTDVLVTIVSGVLSSKWLHNPLTHLAREAWKQRRIAEFAQTIQQMMFPASLLVNPQVTFAEPVAARQLGSQEDIFLEKIIDRARRLLDTHSSWIAAES